MKNYTECPTCNKKQVIKDSKPKSQLVAWGAILVGIILLPVFIGIVPLLAGLIMGFQKDNIKRCENCGWEMIEK